MLPRKLCPPVRERHKGRLLVTQVLLVTLQVTSAPLLAHGPVCLVQATPPPPLLGWSSELSTGSRPGHPKKQVPLPTGGMLPHTACQSAGGCHRPSPAPPDRAATADVHFSHFLGWTAKAKVSAGLVSPGPPPSACRRPPSPCVLTWLLLCAQTSPVSLPFLVLLDYNPTLWGSTSFNLNCLPKGSVSKQVTLGHV